MRSRSLCSVLCFVLLVSLFSPFTGNAEEVSAVYVAEALTGEQIAAENADTPMFPAALTKLMSFLLFFEALDAGTVHESDSVLVSKNAAEKGGASVFLDEGSVYAFSELLKAAVVSSGNDATVALAEHIAGSEAAFTDRMNTRLKELGLSGNFTDPTGLDKNTSVSAKTLANIACHLSRYPDFFNYSSIWTYTFTHSSGRTTELTSANKLIKQEGFDGFATGSSSEAGYCLAATCASGRARFISVVLGAVNSEKRFTVARELLNEASASWGVYEAAKEGAPIKSQKIGGSKQDSVDICAKDDLILLVKKQDEQNISKSIDVYELKAPLKAGDKAGELAVTLPDGKKYTVDLIVSEDVEQASVGVSFKRIAALWINAA